MDGYGLDMLKYPMFNGISNNMPWGLAGNLNSGADPMMALLMRSSSGGGGLNSGLMEALLGLSQTSKESTEKLNEKTETAQKEAEKAKKELEEKKETQNKEEKSGDNYSTGDIACSVAKGIGGLVTDLVCEKDEKGERHFSIGKTLLSAGVATVAILAAPVTIAGVSIGSALAVTGGIFSGLQVKKGIEDYSKAKTYKDKDAAVQEIAGGGAGVGLSVLGVKSINAAQGAKTAKAAEALSEGVRGLTSTVGKAGTLSGRDAKLITAIQEQLDVIEAVKNGSREMRDASKTLSTLLKLAQKEGTNPEIKAAIAKAVEESPEIAQVFKLGIKKPIIGTGKKTVIDLKGKEKPVLEQLKAISATKPEEQELIKEATTLLESLQTEGADIGKLRIVLQKLQKTESVSDVLKITDLAKLQRALSPNISETALSAGKGSLRMIGRTVKGTAKAVTYPVRERKDFLLKTGLTSAVVSSRNNMAIEEQRQEKQDLRFAKLGKEIKAQEEKVKNANSEYRNNLEALARRYKINPKDKTDEKLRSEIADAKAEIAKAKEAKEAKAKAAAK